MLWLSRRDYNLQIEEGFVSVKKCKWFLLLCIFLSYFINPYVPVEWGWENSVLEWLQVVILAVGMVLNYRWVREVSYHNPAGKRFLAWTMPLWLLIIGRELSWGRVFYPSGFNAVKGPSFLPLAQLPYGQLVYPLLAIMLIVWLYIGIKYVLYKIPCELVKERQFPIAEMIITVIALIVAEVAEHKLRLQAMEEMNECFVYLGLILLVYHVKEVLNKRKRKIL